MKAETLQLFSHSMATCLNAGFGPKRSLELSVRGLRSKTLRRVVGLALPRCEQGVPLSEALAPGARFFPHHYLPIIRAGEAGGRQVEAFQLLHEHTGRLGPSLRLVRNTWLYPLVCIGFGWLVKMGILLYFGHPELVLPFVMTTFGNSSGLVLLGWTLFRFRMVRHAIDRVLLQLPVVRESEVRLAELLFFATLRLAYETGSVSVLPGFDLARQTVRNTALQQELLGARAVLDRHGSFAEAFDQVPFLEDRLKGLVKTGSVSGRLDQALTVITEDAAERLGTTLKTFNEFFQRLVVLTVAMSIVETIFIVTMR